MVDIVIPDIGLFDEPTIPAMYAAMAEKRKAIISIVNEITILNNKSLNILR